MSWTAIASEGIGLAKEIFKLMNTKESKEYSDKLSKAERQLYDEKEATPMGEQNDALIEKLESDITIYQKAAGEYVKTLIANKSN